MNKKMDETLVAQYKDLAIQRLEDAACRVFKYDKESDDFQQCGKPSAVIVDQDGPLETVFCAECYMSGVKPQPDRAGCRYSDSQGLPCGCKPPNLK